MLLYSKSRVISFLPDKSEGGGEQTLWWSQGALKRYLECNYEANPAGFHVN